MFSRLGLQMYESILYWQKLFAFFFVFFLTKKMDGKNRPLQGSHIQLDELFFFVLNNLLAKRFNY